MFNLSGFIAKDAENEQLSLCGPAVLVYLGWSSLSGVYNHQFTCSAASGTSSIVYLLYLWIPPGV